MPRRPITEIWPIAMDSVLPTMPIPLQQEDADVALDLQQAFFNVYDVCHYDLIIDYEQPPDVPLPPATAAWARKRVKAWKKRA